MAGEIVDEMQGIPDFIVRNYSDGNLVASLLAYKMVITQDRTDSSLLYQCKSIKLSVSKGIFIITSTYQEIVGIYAFHHS